jgi:hypothetical protein
MSNVLRALIRSAATVVGRHRLVARALLGAGALAVIVDGLLLERSTAHLLVLHPLLLLALAGGYVLLEGRSSDHA